MAALRVPFLATVVLYKLFSKPNYIEISITVTVRILLVLPQSMSTNVSYGGGFNSEI